MAAVINKYLKQADGIELSNGNLFNPLDFGTSIYGSWGVPGKPKAHRKYIAAGFMLLSTVAALTLMGKNKDRS